MSVELAASSSQNSLPASSSIAASSSQNSLPGCSSLVLREEDVPGASLNGYEPSQHVVELKRWLKCRTPTIVGKKQDLVNW